jgi:hypothetical protein
VKLTAPVASAGSPLAERVTVFPYVVLVGPADAVNDVAAGTTVKSAVAVEPT